MEQSTHIIKTGKPFILVFLFLSFFACDEKQNPVPNVYVDFEVNLNDPQFNTVIIPGNYIYLTGGVNGIILYHTVDDQYKAFDRTCTYDPECGKVYVSEDQLKAVDTVCCGSVFSLLVDGIVEQGPAEFPLKQYQCIYNSNAHILRIKN